MAHRRKATGDITIQQRVGLFLRLYAELKKEPYSQRTQMSITFSPAGTQTDTQREEFRSYLWAFRQLISPDDSAYLETILRVLPRHVDDAALRQRLGNAMDAWKAANGIPSPIAPLVMGDFASGHETARLYLYSGVAHSEPQLAAIWDSLRPSDQQFVEYQVRVYESNVRNVVIELKKVIDEANARGVLRDQPLDLGAATPV
jgi:hypothetical protein